MLGDVSVKREVVTSAPIAGVDSMKWTVVFLSKLGGSSTLSADVSSVIKEDFTASVDANVAHLVTGWTPLMDSSLKGSVVLNATTNASYEQLEVCTISINDNNTSSSVFVHRPFSHQTVVLLFPLGHVVVVVVVVVVAVVAATVITDEFQSNVAATVQ